MSELTISKHIANFRVHLLTGVSAAVLTLYVAGNALADDADRPTIWIELGGQWEQMNNSEEPYDPPFVANLPKDFLSPLAAQKPLGSSFGGEGSISFEPSESDWVFSASVRFGRSNGARNEHQQTPNAKVPLDVFLPTSLPPPFGGLRVKYGSYYPRVHVKFNDVKTQRSETHTILDFQAGRDVGLGIFGGRGTSIVSAGIRYAQFSSKATVSLQALPDVHYPSAPVNNKYELNAFRSGQDIRFHAYTAFGSAVRSFRGLGPSLTWKASAPFLGNTQRGEIAFDWGLNGAVLFGRQKSKGHHQSTVQNYNLNLGWNRGINGINGCGITGACEKSGFFQGTNYYGPTATHRYAGGFSRSRTVIVPNIGGMAGISFRYSNAKVSFGYRADFFFGAMDGGIDVRKSENLGFYGPFASVSVGIGG